MEYHQIGIQRLSHPQISKLLNGHAVRVKHGGGHTIHVSKEQHKKIMSAHRRGAGCNLCMDPYQMHMHKSSGIFDSIKRGVKAIAHSSIARELVKKAAPVAINLGKKMLEEKLDEFTHGHGEGLHSAHRSRHGHGEGMEGDGEGFHSAHRSRHGHGEGHRIAHPMQHLESYPHLEKHIKKARAHKKKTKVSKKEHKDQTHAHRGTTHEGGALLPAGYGEGHAHARRRGKGISGKDVLDGLVRYALPAASMFL